MYMVHANISNQNRRVEP